MANENESMIEKTVRVSLEVTSNGREPTKKILIIGLPESEAMLYQKMAQHLAYAGIGRGETYVEVNLILRKPAEKKKEE